jgi:transposase
MVTRRIVLHGQTREKLKRIARRCKDADLRIRYQIIIHSSHGWSCRRIARALGCCCSTVSRTLDRWEQFGQAGLLDRREDNGQAKADPQYVATVRWILASTPQAFLHRRPTWTKALLIETARQYTGVTVSKTTMGRVLKSIGARRGRPKPQAPCPWSQRVRKLRMAAIHRMIESLPKDQACVWEDEADIDLNPKIGPDWMLPGTQRHVMTPGKNIKRYFAGAMDALSDRVMWVKGPKKNSRLFIEMLKKLLVQYTDRTIIHVVLDNYVIHASRQTRLWLAEFGQKFRLHFLPPYCPDDNRIERKIWREMHANVTVNHRCRMIDELCREVVWWMMRYNRSQTALGVRELRAAI